VNENIKEIILIYSFSTSKKTQCMSVIRLSCYLFILRTKQTSKYTVRVKIGVDIDTTDGGKESEGRPLLTYLLTYSNNLVGSPVTVYSRHWLVI
jgi:hypothetical protein